MIEIITQPRFNYIDVVTISTFTNAAVNGEFITAVAVFVTGLALSLWVKK